MSYRVSHTRKDLRGNITAIGVKGSWELASSTAVQRIENREEAYHVEWPEKRTDIHVAGPSYNRFLRTDRDNTTRNNLEDLPPL